MNTSVFLTDDQKMTHLMGVAGYDPKVYRYRSLVKIYEGAEILLYHFDKDDAPVFDNVLVCSGFIFTERSIKVTLIERKTWKLQTISEIPSRLTKLDLLCSVPVRCILERTMKTTSNSRLMFGLTAALAMLSKSDPVLRRPHHIQAISLNKAPSIFSDAEYNDAEQRAAMEG